MKTEFLTQGEIEGFQRDGFLVVPQLLDAEETELLGTIARRDRALATARTSRADGEGGAVELVVENELPEGSIYSAIVQGQPLVDAMEVLLGGEVYHYHHKMILKEPRTGGAWTWHQDYGYWYNNGCLWPNMASCMISVTPSTKENGCLQVIRASHLLGRIDHVKIGDQTGADLERVEAALERLEHVYVESAAGDALFFHSNLLHRSDQNLSDSPRWSLICCYNARSNNPYKESKHPSYTPLEKVADDAILNWTSPSTS
ncbi:MAG: phytanoyl-CoA dioxygenase family protein [Planctomycetaceae bacterium]|nr:phytanoyl-CoA dioxygenase family protein [Planctomycetaceae bacterium]